MGGNPLVRCRTFGLNLRSMGVLGRQTVPQAKFSRNRGALEQIHVEACLEV